MFNHLNSINDLRITEIGEIAEEFRNYFERTYKAPDKANNFNLSEYNQNLCVPFIICSKDILKRINKLKSSKSQGPDGIRNKALKLGSQEIIPYLKRIFNVAVNNGQVPEDWKYATVVPIHKGGRKKLLKNYRPISLTSVVCKVFEKMIADHLKDIWETTGWLNGNQHGFRKGFSCDAQMLGLSQDLIEAQDRGDQVDAVVVDLAKAFDVVDHSLLIQKMSMMAVDPRI